MLIGRLDESGKQRMRFERLGFEFRMELAAQEPRMVRDLADLDVHAVRGLAGDAQAALRENLLIFAVEFVAMAVALADLGGP